MTQLWSGGILHIAAILGIAYKTSLMADKGESATIKMNRAEAGNALGVISWGILLSGARTQEVNYAAGMMTMMAFNQDAKEGFAAFVEKRKQNGKAGRLISQRLSPGLAAKVANK